MRTMVMWGVLAVGCGGDSGGEAVDAGSEYVRFEHVCDGEEPYTWPVKVEGDGPLPIIFWGYDGDGKGTQYTDRIAVMEDGTLSLGTACSTQNFGLGEYARGVLYVPAGVVR